MNKPNWLIKVIPRVAIVAVTLAVLVIPILPQQGVVHAAPADAYWVGGTGNWTDATHHWATSSNGTPNAANTPDTTTNTHFDALSNNGTSNWVVNIDGVSSTKNMDWTGATNSPTLINNANLTIAGNVTLVSNMAYSVTGLTTFFSGSTQQNITSNGITWGTSLRVNNTVGIVLQDNFTISTGNDISWATGVFNTNNKTFSVPSVDFNGAGVRTLTLGSSTVNCTNWDASGTNQILTANTATINVSGATFSGGGLLTYNVVNLNGATHTVSGNNTYASFSTNSSVTQTITFTDRTSQTATTLNLGGSIGHQHTLQGSGALGWSVNQTSGAVVAPYITISRSTGVITGGANYTATAGSVDGGNNVNWLFPLTISTGASSGIAMDKDGIVSGNFTGTISDMGGNATAQRWFNYGLTIAYGNTTSNITVTTTNFSGTQNAPVASNLTLGSTYHYQLAITAGSNTTQNGDASFTLTLPSVTTNAPTTSTNGGTHATLNGNVTNMGVATSTYTSFQYSTDLSFSHSTPEVVQSGVGAFSATISGFIPNTSYNVRAVTRNGTTFVYGGTQTFAAIGSTTFSLIDLSIIIIIALLLIVVLQIALPEDTNIIVRLVLIGVVVSIILGLLPGLQNLLSALQ